MKKLNIAFLLISEGWAGAENSLYNLASRLSNSANVSLFLNQELMKYYSNMTNVKLYDLGCLFDRKGVLRLLSYLKIIKNLKKILKENSFDLITLYLESSYIVYYPLYKKIKVPVVISLRGTEINRFFEKSKGIPDIINKICLKRAFDKSDLIISISKWQIKKLLGEYKRKIVVIPNGIDLKKFKPVKDIKQEKNVILFVGRFIELKGIREIINVASQLPEYEFWFVGQGPMESLINLPNTKNLGFKNKKELIKLYNKSTICIAPSYHESFNNVGLEAASCRRTLICTPKGFSEYIKNGYNGIIIPPKNENALKNAIIRLMTDKILRKKIERNARKTALNYYTWDKVAQQHLNLFKEVVE